LKNLQISMMSSLKAQHENPKTKPKAAKKPAAKHQRKPLLHLLNRKRNRRQWHLPWKRKEKESDQKDDPKASASPSMSEAQKRAIYNLSRRRGISVEEVGDRWRQMPMACDLESLTSTDASSFIRNCSKQPNL
jgi:hypothetical protein